MSYAAKKNCLESLAPPKNADTVGGVVPHWQQMLNERFGGATKA
jgi:hypothetical protein